MSEAYIVKLLDFGQILAKQQAKAMIFYRPEEAII